MGFWDLFKKFQGAPDVLDGKMHKMADVYKDMDGDVAEFQRGCGFECLKVCGHCCENPMVEATELEMLPLAGSLVQAGTAEDWYLVAEQHDFSGRCIFFQPEIKPGVRGHCGIYEHRPLVCRLFSSSCNQDKYGKLRLIVCSPIKQAFGPFVDKAEADILSGRLKAPMMATYAMRAMAVDADLERERYPINMAFKKAVDRVWIHQQFAGKS